MQIYKIDNREIRSFKLRQKNLELQSFFADKNSVGTFMMAETLHPEDRISFRKENKQFSLNITTISRRNVKLWGKTNKWNSITNLLSGNVIKIAPTNNKTFDKNTLKFLIQHKKFNLHFLCWNQQLYRKTHALNFIAKNIEHFEIKTPIKNLMRSILNGRHLGDKLLIHRNYN